MNMKTFEEILRDSHEQFISEMARDLKKAGLEVSEANLKHYQKQVEVLKELLTYGYRSQQMPDISIAEALQSADASILFPRAISDIMMRGREPMMIGQTVLAKTIQAPQARSIEFPSVGALRAFDVAETEEYPEQSPAFTRMFIEIKVTKSGLAFGVSHEIIEDSMWDILGYMIEAAGYALMRHKEQKLFNEALAKGHPVFDNSVNDPNFWTHGMRNGSYNYTLHFDDLIDALGALVAHEYVPTDIVMHPLAWTVFAKDPILRAQFLTGGQIGQSVWSTMPQFDQSVNVPWNINYVVSPFMPIRLRTTISGHSGDGGMYPDPSTLPVVNVTDVLIVDRNNALLILQREPMNMEEFEDFRRDTRMMKFRERYGIAALNQGRAIAAIKNIRLDINDAPIFTVRTIATP